MRNKTVIITGGASGIGKAAVRLFASAGAMWSFPILIPYKGHICLKKYI